MSDFTYEKEDKKDILEEYEWDNVWIDHATDKQHARVLYIGDSISCGVRRIATEISGNSVYFDGFGTSKAVDNPFFKESVGLFISQLPKVETIVFNNGLHGWHLEDGEEYGAYYEKMIRYLVEKLCDVSIFIALTTFVRDEGRCGRVDSRNKTAAKIAEKYGLPVIDLYSVTKEKKSLLAADGANRYFFEGVGGAK